LTTPRLRFAPSPTGHLHIGGARTALFNWAWARRTGGKFLLRIEDTDKERSKDEYERSILAGLRWLGVEWDEGPDVGGPFGPYRQSEKYPRYHAAAEELVAKGAAYPCFCSAERLEKLREEKSARNENPAYDGHCRTLAPSEAARRRAAGEPCVIRFKVPEGKTRLLDLIRGEVVFDNKEVEDWVMVRSSGDPIYNYVVVIDDIDMQITHVMRGEEHLTNTPKQVLLYQAFGKTPPIFAHLPLMLGADKKKLSKRTGDTSLQDYRDKGYPSEAVMNFLALQGWALDDKTTVFSKEQLIERFDPKDVSPAGAVFDPEKFLWMSGEYIRHQTTELVAERSAPYVVAAGLATAEELARDRARFHAAVAAEKERIKLYAELPARIAYLFAADEAVSYAEDALAAVKKHANRVATLTSYQEWLAPRLEPLEPPRLREETKAWVKAQNLAMPALFQPLRCALTGALGGVDLFDAMALLGAARVRARLASALTRLA